MDVIIKWNEICLNPIFDLIRVHHGSKLIIRNQILAQRQGLAMQIAFFFNLLTKF